MINVFCMISCVENCKHDIHKVTFRSCNTLRKNDFFCFWLDVDNFIVRSYFITRSNQEFYHIFFDKYKYKGFAEIIWEIFTSHCQNNWFLALNIIAFIYFIMYQKLGIQLKDHKEEFHIIYKFLENFSSILIKIFAIIHLDSAQ